MIKKERNFPLPCPLSLNVDCKMRESMNSSGLECETCLVHFKGIKGESEWI